jgi:putative toxin-antitoxin system antitoxin component (TIGR02293 family)
MNTGRIEEFLGPLPRAGRGRRACTSDLHRIVDEGLPAAVIAQLEKSLQLSATESARILAVSRSSRKRLKQAPRKRLDVAASDRIMRVASTIADAADVFGDTEKAVGWFKTQSIALGGRTPLELMTSDPGTRLVREELDRIRYGHWA